MEETIFNGAFWISILVSALAIFISLAIFAIQIRPRIEVNSRTAVKPYIEGTNRRAYILYADIRNSGMTPISFTVKTYSEKNRSAALQYNLGNADLYREEFRSYTCDDDSGDLIEARNKVHKLNSGESTYIVIGYFDFEICDPTHFNDKLKLINGRTETYIDAIFKLKYLRKLLSRKLETDFNKLYADTAETR